MARRRPAAELNAWTQPRADGLPRAESDPITDCGNWGVFLPERSPYCRFVRVHISLDAIFRFVFGEPFFDGVAHDEVVIVAVLNDGGRQPSLSVTPNAGNVVWIESVF